VPILSRLEAGRRWQGLEVSSYVCALAALHLPAAGRSSANSTLAGFRCHNNADSDGFAGIQEQAEDPAGVWGKHKFSEITERGIVESCNDHAITRQALDAAQRKWSLPEPSNFHVLCLNPQQALFRLSFF